MTHGERHQMIEQAKDAIAASGGWILDFKLFSNISICINFELPVNEAIKLRNALEQTDVILSDASLRAFNEIVREAEQESPWEDLRGSLQLTFIHDEPDLRIPVPMVPG